MKAPKTNEEALARANAIGAKRKIADQAIEQKKQPEMNQPTLPVAPGAVAPNNVDVQPATPVPAPVVVPTDPNPVPGTKPTISPTLQAKINAKKGLDESLEVPQQKQVIEPAPVEAMPEVKVEPVKQEVKSEVIPELTDAEKNAQATGVKYEMKDGIPVYNPTTTEEATKILSLGGKLAQETKVGAVAQANIDKARKLAQMTDTQLAANISNGLVSSRELETLNRINPQLVAKAQELSKKTVITNTANEIQNDNAQIAEGGEPNGMTPSLAELLKKLENIDANNRSPKEIREEYYNNNPAMQEAKTAINQLTTQKRELQVAKMDLFDEYRRQNAGYPMSAIMAGYSTLSRGLDNQIYMINDNLNTEIANYNSYLDEVNSEIEWETAQQGKEEERLWNTYGVTKAEEVRQEDIMRKDKELQMAMEQAQSEQEYNTYKDERDFNFKVAEQKIKSGQWEAEYGLKAAEYDLKTQQAEMDAQKGNWSVKDGVLINADTGETKPMQSVVSAQGLATPMVQNLLDQCRIEGQCGEGANDYLQKLGAGRLLGNTYTSKTDDINSYTPVLGSVAVWNPQGDTVGHAGIVLENRGDKLLIRDWNYGLDEKQQIHEVPISAISNSGGGYIVPDKLKEMQIPEAQKNILNAIEELEDHPGLNAAVGFGLQKFLPGNQADEGFLPSSDAEDFRVNFMSFRDNIVLPNLELLKGAMSDNDIKFIRNAGTPASLGMSEKAFKAELTRIKNNIYEKFGMEKRAYAPDEEALIKKLAQQGATDDEIDQALNLYRS